LGAFDGTNEKGYYTVSVMSGTSQEPRGSGAFAVNLSSEESKFDLADEEQFREWLPGVELTMFDASAQAEQLHGAVGDEREIWRPLIALMFVIIIIEFLLATLGGGRTDAEEPQTVMQRILDASPGRWVGRMTGGGARHVEAN
jgi:hypothetical protein